MRRKLPSITALLCFEAAAKTENFANAAKRVNITQSALSRQIQILEAFLQQTLFTRTKQRVKLTAAGKSLAFELSPQLEKLELTLLDVQLHDKAIGALNIGAYPTLGSRWLMPILMQKSQLLSELTINTITFLSNQEIDSSVIDLAIVQGDPPFPGFRQDYLMSETLVIVASPKTLEAPMENLNDLLEHRILQHSTRPESWEIFFKSAGKTLSSLPVGPIFTQFEMLIDAVKAGHGLAIIPKILVAKELLEETLIMAYKHECQPESAYYLLTPTAKVGIRKLERLRKWFLKSQDS